ncbi:hypothetical protein NHQ30_007446 [Ciborinia camelliae]|nr:hypothetical protein NHQ30_007446 [Ciborinia camelliae]
MNPLMGQEAIPDHKTALKKCYYKSLTAQSGIPLTKAAANVNCFSHVRISANVALRDAAHCTPGPGIKCGPWVTITTFGGDWGGDWGGEGGSIMQPDVMQKCNLRPAEILVIRKEHRIYNTPISEWKQRYQLEFFMPELENPSMSRLMQLATTAIDSSINPGRYEENGSETGKLA